MADLATTLYLRDLSLLCAEEDIERIFEAWGPIVSMKLWRNLEGGEPTLHAFVKFSSTYKASRALQQMNGTAFVGKPLR